MKLNINKITFEKIFEIYFFLFIFTTINREFVFFGIDLRFILVALSFIILINKILFSKLNIILKNLNKYEILLIVFYILLFLSNIMFIFNNEEFIINEFISLMILHINNFLALLVFILNKEQITFNKTIKYLKIAIIVLALSFVCLLFNIPIPSIFTSGERMISIGFEHYNLFGGNFRISGFAEDANYAFLFFYTMFLLLLKKKCSSNEKLILIICFFGMAFSFSKTQILMIVPTLLIYILVFKLQISIINKKFIILVILLIIFLSPIILMKFNVLGSMQTLSTRYTLWGNAMDMFQRNYFFPSGIGGFRFYNYYNYIDWMVQTHSTYIEVLTEIGIIPFFILMVICYKCAIKYKGTFFLVLFNYLCFSITYETLYLQYFIFVIYILYVCIPNINGIENNEKKVLFFVNSLSEGGAERVCVNLGNWYKEHGYKVDYIILFNKHAQQIDNKNGQILSLNLDPKLSKFQIIKSIFYRLSVINQFITKQEANGKYDLITAHLPLSHICAYFSDVNNRCLFVQHTSLLSDEKMSLFYKLFYRNKMNICVSEGLSNEFVSKMKYDTLKVKTIYNPVNIKRIQHDAFTKNIEYKPYILCVGRMSREKRFDRAIEVFYQGKFYEQFNLVFLGKGELEFELKRQVKLLNLENKVYFLGWKKNVYSWMKNAELLLQTSEREALSMVLIEALASGTKVVASNCEFGANEILRNNLQKYIAIHDDIEDYINKINLALNEFSLNKDYEILHLCQDDVVCQKYLNVYNNLFGKEGKMNE